jgi:hypothetical protein
MMSAAFQAACAATSPESDSLPLLNESMRNESNFRGWREHEPCASWSDPPIQGALQITIEPLAVHVASCRPSGLKARK